MFFWTTQQPVLRSVPVIIIVVVVVGPPPFLLLSPLVGENAPVSTPNVNYIHRLMCVIPDFLVNSRFALDVVEAEVTAQFASTASPDPALVPRVGTAFRSLTGKRVPHGDGWASLRSFHHIPCVPLQRFTACRLSHPTRDSAWASRVLREEKTATGT